MLDKCSLFQQPTLLLLERLFSKAGQIVADRQVVLESDNVERLLFLRTVWPVVESMSKENEKKELTIE